MLVAIASAALAIACVRSHWSDTGRVGPSDMRWWESIALGCVHALVICVAIVTVGSVLGLAHAVPIACAQAMAAGWIGWRLARRAPDRAVVDASRNDARTRHAVWLWLVLLVGIGVRCPPGVSALGGQDQGSYTLRAQASLRTGSLAYSDPVLARAESGAEREAGDADLLGMYPIVDDPTRQDIYEGAYRPGFYLADRASGRVVPQFFAGHPAGMQLVGLIAGPSKVHLWAGLCSALALLCFALLLRRLAGARWAALGLAIFALCPTAIWTQSLTLSEAPSAMWLCAAGLASLRAEAQTPTQAPIHRDAHLAAFTLAAFTWTRGEAWVLAPLLALALWWRPESWRARAPWRDALRAPALDAGQCFVVCFVVGAVAHANIAFPYIHDEFLRRFDTLGPLRPASLSVAFVAAGVIWWMTDARLRRTRATRSSADDSPNPHRVLALVALALIAWHLLGHVAPAVVSIFGPDQGDSRLDPLPASFGWPLVTLAAVALVRRSVFVRSDPRGDTTFTATLAGLAGVGTLALFLPGGLPQAHLFYYGRYLTHLLLPLTIAVVVVDLADIARGERRWQRAFVWSAAFAALIGVAWPLVAGTYRAHSERVGARVALEELARRLPDDAIVVAGGEGWHRGFTEHQVATALAFRHGVTVLPYRNRESAIVSTRALLAGERPVFWLVNEASHHYTREDDGVVIAGSDVLLPDDLRATSLVHVELWLHRHTPTRGAVPLRRTRDGMRMSLVRLEQDPTRLRVQAIDAERGCLPRRGKLEVDISEDLRGPGELVAVLDPRDAIENLGVRIWIDDRAKQYRSGDDRPRPRASFGPFERPQGSRRLELRGFPRAKQQRSCPHGRILALHWTAPPHPARLDAPPRVIAIEPKTNYGNAYKRSAWVPGRAAQRFRPALLPNRPLQDLSVRVSGERSAQFEAMFLPAGAGAYDLVATLTRMQVSPNARVEIWIDGQRVQRFDPPDGRKRSWQSPKMTWRATRDWARIELRLVDAKPGEFIDLRDLALFSRVEAVTADAVRTP